MIRKILGPSVSYDTFCSIFLSNLYGHITQNHQEVKSLLKTKIKEDKVYNCDQCDLKFVTNAILKYHKLRAHGGKSKFVIPDWD